MMITKLRIQNLNPLGAPTLAVTPRNLSQRMRLQAAGIKSWKQSLGR